MSGQIGAVIKCILLKIITVKVGKPGKELFVTCVYNPHFRNLASFL